jgi:lipoprotein-anchoring transpeptidase ErfK/SrfK
MQRSHSVRLPGLALTAILIAACSGGSGSTGGSPGAHGTPTTPPLKVASVVPLTLTSTSPIVVTFRQPLPSDSTLPSLEPAVPGSWVRSGATATFTPTQAYPPSTSFHVQLVRRSGGAEKTIAKIASAPGSLRFADQILARLKYLPLDTKAAQPATPADEAAAVFAAPKGRFTWRYPNTPTVLVHDWKPDQPNVVLRGAVIAFQHQWHLTQDGAVGPATWKALLNADATGATDPDHYSYVSADLYPRPQTLQVWVDGRTALTTPVNGGVPGAPTPLGTYPIYLRYTATTMQGTNPDGTKYKDKGVPWVNYFSGGSAVHGFQRASYGFPQSVGCLELPPATAKTVYGLIDYGTLVNVTGPFVPTSSATPSPPVTATPKSSGKPKSGGKPKPTGKPGKPKPKPSSSGSTPTPTPSTSS